MIIRNKSIFILLLMTWACNDNKISTDITTIDASKRENFVDKIIINDYAKSKVKIISLESSSESLFTKIYRIYFYGDNIYILSLKDKAILIFSQKGKFINKIQNIGRGPGEYSQVSDFTINTETNEIILMANIPEKYLFFDLEGKYKRELPVKEYYYGINFINNSYLFLNHNSRSINNEPRAIIKKNLSSRKTVHELPFSEPSVGYNFNSPYSILSNSVLFCSSFIDNTIYSCTGNIIKPKYIIDFANKKLPKDMMTPTGLSPEKGMEEFMVITHSDFYYYPYNIRESESYLFFSFISQFPYNCVFNKQNQTLQISREFYDNDLNISLPNYYAHDGQNDQIAFIVSPQILKSINDHWSYFNISAFNKDFFLQFENISDETNPVIFLYDLQ